MLAWCLRKRPLQTGELFAGEVLAEKPAGGFRVSAKEARRCGVMRLKGLHQRVWHKIWITTLDEDAQREWKRRRMA